MSRHRILHTFIWVQYSRTMHDYQSRMTLVKHNDSKHESTCSIPPPWCSIVSLVFKYRNRYISEHKESCQKRTAVTLVSASPILLSWLRNNTLFSHTWHPIWTERSNTHDQIPPQKNWPIHQGSQGLKWPRLINWALILSVNTSLHDKMVRSEGRDDQNLPGAVGQLNPPTFHHLCLYIDRCCASPWC
jgi:hypothetical protein